MGIRSKEMTYRGAMRLLRIQKVWLAMEYYSLFAQRQMNHELLSHKADYASSEKMAEFLSFLTKEVISPQDFIQSNEEMTNEIFRCHDKMEEIIALGGKIGISREELDAFSKEVFYTFKNQSLKIYHIQLCYIIGGFVKYMVGVIGKRELNKILKFPSSPFSTIPLKKSYLRKCYMDTYNRFNAIVEKRIERDLKKEEFWNELVNVK